MTVYLFDKMPYSKSKKSYYKIKVQRRIFLGHSSNKPLSIFVQLFWIRCAYFFYKILAVYIYLRFKNSKT